MKNLMNLFVILLLEIGMTSCKSDGWETDNMRTGAILQITTKGVPTTNYEAKFYEGIISNVHSDVATGVKEPSNKLFRVKKGNDGKAQNLWLPVGPITVVVVNHDTKSFAFTSFDTQLDSYAVLKADFDNTTDCGCGNLYREKWDTPVTFVR